MKIQKLFYFLRYRPLGFFIVLLCSVCIMGFQMNPTQENSAPIVRIISPKANTTFHWNTDVQYSIQVIDKEDGNSAYDEIENREVLLQITYLPDSMNLVSYQKSRINIEEPEALSLMKTTTCLTCHTSRDILIGPSFDRIASRYTYSEETVSALASKVLKGSKGTWGEIQMPSNTDLREEEIEVIIRWILKNNLNSNEFYQSGLKGTFRMKERSGKDTGNGVLILTASYVDHGISGNPNLRKKGDHTLVLRQTKQP